MWPATVTTSVRGASGGPADDELLGEAVDEVRAVDVPADVEPDERHAAPALDRDDLAEQDRRVLRQVVARLAARRRRRAARGGGRGPPRRRRGRPAARPRGPGAPSPPPTLTSAIGQPAARSALDRLDGAATSAASNAGQPVGQPARAGVEVDRVDRQVVPRAAASASSSRSRPIPNFVGRSPRVLEVLVVPGAGARDRSGRRSRVPGARRP